MRYRHKIFAEERRRFVRSPSFRLARALPLYTELSSTKFHVVGASAQPSRDLT
jgi:hypothetical protein